jgi:glycerol-3-phosphate acyltransferase PlsY
LQFLPPFLAVLAAYLLGSLSFAVIVSRAMGLSDPRSYGSKNPGATNVLRSGNKAAAALTLLLDAIKGWLPVTLVAGWGGAWGLGPDTLALVALAAFLGHVFPVFFKFAGGKGVAAAAGVLLGLSAWLGLAVGLTWLLVARVSRYSSLGALTAAVLAPIYYLLGDGWLWHSQLAVALAVLVMGAVLVWRHSANISRLRAGTEPKIGSKG